jgi:hypothetical protein
VHHKYTPELLNQARHTFKYHCNDLATPITHLIETNTLKYKPSWLQQQQGAHSVSSMCNAACLSPNPLQHDTCKGLTIGS